MGIIYQTIIRSHIVKDIELVPIEPWTENSPILAAKYLKNVKNNCLETHHEIYIDAQNKRNLHIMNYPIHPKAHSVSFTNFACDEYDGAYFEITFRFENGQTQTEEVFTDSSSFSRFMLIVPELMNGKKAKSVSYEVGSSPATNCYDLKRYDGSKHSSTEDEFYKQFRCNDYGSRRCPVCYPDQEDSETESESETESVESIIQITKESKDESILGPDFTSVPVSESESETESIESIIQITKESKDGSILGPDFISVPVSESESETESIESIIQMTKEQEDGSILGPDFMSVPVSELISIPESTSKLVQESESKSFPESESESDPESKSTNSESAGKLVKLNSVSGQLQAIFHKIRAIFKYLDTNGILRHETISRRKKKFGKSKSLPTMARQLSTLSDVFITTLNY